MSKTPNNFRITPMIAPPQKLKIFSAIAAHTPPPNLKRGTWNLKRTISHFLPLLALPIGKWPMNYLTNCTQTTCAQPNALLPSKKSKREALPAATANRQPPLWTLDLGLWTSNSPPPICLHFPRFPTSLPAIKANRLNTCPQMTCITSVPDFTPKTRKGKRRQPSTFDF